jgi:hypothetical protein
MPVWSRAELESDLDAWLDWTRSTHPAFEQSVDLGAFEQELKQVRLDLRDGMDTSDAWYAFARLNPVLNDAHLGLELPAIDSGLEPWRVEIENARALCAGAWSRKGSASGDRLCRWRFCAGDDHAYFACCPRRIRCVAAAYPGASVSGGGYAESRCRFTPCVPDGVCRRNSKHGVRNQKQSPRYGKMRPSA